MQKEGHRVDERQPQHGGGKLGAMHGFVRVQAPHLHAAVQSRREHGAALRMQLQPGDALGVGAYGPHVRDLIQLRLLPPHFHLGVPGPGDDQAASSRVIGHHHHGHHRDWLVVQAGPHVARAQHHKPRLAERVAQLLALAARAGGKVTHVVDVQVGRPEDEQQLQLRVQVQLLHPGLVRVLGRAATALGASVRATRAGKEGEVQLEALEQSHAAAATPQALEGRRGEGGAGGGVRVVNLHHLPLTVQG
mmetsp:Transcript_18358/g.34936  ORF Transcript_18358/g.34936 Transcript_18358/m.34936 type:complete len:248 (+) Transcript_18358:455-1198(+)